MGGRYESNGLAFSQVDGVGVENPPVRSRCVLLSHPAMADEAAAKMAEMKVDEGAPKEVDPHNRPQKGKKSKKDKPKKPKPVAKEEPKYIQERIDIFDRLWAEHEAEIAAKDATPIKITLPDGKEVDGEAWRTSPMDIAKGISEGLARDCIVSYGGAVDILLHSAPFPSATLSPSQRGASVPPSTPSYPSSPAPAPLPGRPCQRHLVGHGARL